MLDVALDELPRRGQQEMGTTQIRPRIQQRQNVLKLVAEPEGASRLVRSAAGPDATTERLIQQPPIDEEVERIVRSVDLHRAERGVPASRRACDRVVHFRETRVPRGQRGCVRRIVSLAQHERDAARFPRRHVNPDLQSRAGVEAGADPPVEALSE